MLCRPPFVNEKEKDTKKGNKKVRKERLGRSDKDCNSHGDKGLSLEIKIIKK